MPLAWDARAAGGLFEAVDQLEIFERTLFFAVVQAVQLAFGLAIVDYAAGICLEKIVGFLNAIRESPIVLVQFFGARREDYKIAGIGLRRDLDQSADNDGRLAAVVFDVIPGAFNKIADFGFRSVFVMWHWVGPFGFILGKYV